MGARGPIPKADDRRQRRNARASVQLDPADEVAGVSLVPDGAVAEFPAPPTGLLKLTRDRWATFWRSDLAAALPAAHRPSVDRLFARYDERERAYRAVQKQGRVTTGSQGQIVAHPLLKYIDACDAEIRALEDRLGLSPRAMVSMGLSLAKKKRSLDDVNRALNDDDADADPRLVAR